MRVAAEAKATSSNLAPEVGFVKHNWIDSSPAMAITPTQFAKKTAQCAYSPVPEPLLGSSNNGPLAN